MIRKMNILLLIMFCIVSNPLCKASNNNWLPSDSLFFSSLKLDAPELKDIRESVYSGDYKTAKKQLLQYKRLSSIGKWFKEPFTYKGASNRVDTQADSLCMHYIYDDNKNPYMAGGVYMGDDFDWMFNPKDKNDPDYAVEWTYSSVSRVNFLNKLATAYENTGNEKYLKKWIWFMHDFINDNPPARKTLWRSLDTAIRIRTWINTYLTFRNSPLFTKEDNVIYLKLIYEHAESLKNKTLMYPARTGNHVTTECSALYTIGCVFQEFEKAEEWRKVAVERFMKEIGRVVPPDGLQAELSPSYHYGVVNTYRNIYNIAIINNIELPDGFTSRLQDMYRAPVFLMDQWGDYVKTNDSGFKNIKEYSREGLELGYDPVLAWVASDGKEGNALPATTSLDYAGFYMMRSGWYDNGMFVFFRGGPQGIGHAEQEKLQIVLKAWGKTLLFDPGKYNYDQSDWRRFSINTPSHNTIIVDGKWQYREKVIPKTYDPVDNPFYTTPLFDYVSANYTDGYVTNIYNPKTSYHPQIWLDDRDTTVVHTRRVLYLKPYYVLVLDQLDGTGNHVFDAHFHIDAPEALLDPTTHSIYSMRDDSIQLALFAIDKNNLKTEIVQGQKAPLLGWYPTEHKPIPTVRFRKKQSTPATFATFLYPYKNHKPFFNIEEIAVNSNDYAWAQRLFTDEETAEVILSKENNTFALSYKSRLIGSNVEAKTKGLVIRRSNLYNDYINVGAWGMTDYKDGRFTLSFLESVNINFKYKDNSVYVLNAGDKLTEMIITKPFKKSVLLEPGQWIVVSDKEKKRSTEPVLFPTFNERKK